jgi:hypothetical protein
MKFDLGHLTFFSLVSIKTQKRFFLVFLLSVKAPLEADPNEFLI